MAYAENQYNNNNKKYRILLLADINSTHTQKWALSLAAKGIEIGLFSLRPLEVDWTKEKKNIQILFVQPKKNIHPKLSRLLSVLLVQQLKDIIEDFKPDIVHAHYASSYGFLGALSGFHPFVLSVWGSDVYNFPKINFLNKWIFKFNLKKADKLCSTSNTMKEEIQKYTHKDISVIPFGIDLNVFKPFYAPHVFKDTAIVIGAVKHLEKEYGMEYLIDAFALLQKRLKGSHIKLLIVGKGSLESELKTRAKDIGIESSTIFTGYIQPDATPFYHNMLNIAVFPSLNESFGVSVAEAMACEKPVIVTNIGGLPEVVENGMAGLIVPAANVEKLAEAIEKLLVDEELRIKLGKEGRKQVERLYNWENNLASMISLYDELLAETKKKL